MKAFILSITLIALTCTWASGESSVWKAEKNESVMYLGGTCHMLRPSDFPLPPEFEKAYNSSDVLVFETDISKLQDPLTQQKILAKARYSDESTIDQHLTASTYQLLSDYCASNNIPVAALKQFKPSIIAMTLSSMELMKLGVTTEGVDLFFYNQATKDNKVIYKLETVEEQINFATEMGKDNSNALITHAIEDIKTIKQDYESLVNAWTIGDAPKLSEMMITKMKMNTPKIYKELLVDRNANWLPMINAYQKTPEKEFILVGVGHLIGQDGIIEALKKMGYKIEKL